MEAGMNPNYEFINRRQGQLMAQSQRLSLLRSFQVRKFSAWGRLIDHCGDILITSGSWLKKASRPPVDKNSMGIFSQN
jgi:hypothetical protein